MKRDVHVHVLYIINSPSTIQRTTTPRADQGLQEFFTGFLFKEKIGNG